MKLTLLESLNEQDIIKAVKERFNASNFSVSGPTYILPDGSFLDITESFDPENSYEDFPCHAEVEAWLIDHDLSLFPYDMTSGSPTLESLGAIRCNDLSDNNFIQLSKIKPTSNQYDSLEDWIYENATHRSELIVATPEFEQYKKYDPEDVDYIIKRIKRYYACGTLYEDFEYKLEEALNESSQMDALKPIAQDIYDAFDEYDVDGNNQNCMLCTWATELQLRGEDILPRPVYSPRDIIFSDKFKGEDIVVNPQKLSIKDKEDVINKVQNAGDGSRFYCHVNWNDSIGGHEFLLVNINDEIYIVDSQSNYIELIEEDDNYFNDINFKNSYIVRLDDKDINQEILKYNDFDYVVEWDEEIDSKMLEEDFNSNSIIAYHGSNAKFSKFDMKYFGRTDDGMWGKGIYFISDKRVAQSFGSDYMYTCRLRLNKPYIIDMSTVGNNEDSEDSSKYYSLTNRNNDVLKRKGYNSIIVKDELWEGSFTTRANEYIVFDSSDIEIIDVKDLSLEESYNSNKNIDDIETPEQLMDWMEENITYELANDEYGAEDDPPTKTAEEVIETGTGHCAEQSYLEYKVLDELEYFPQLIFVKENNSEDDYGADGSAHMFVVYQDEDDKYTYFEHSQEHNKGIHKFNSMSKLLDFVGKNWWRYDSNSNILEVRYIDEPITGVNNWELAQECHKYPVDEVLDISNNVMEKDMISENLTEAKKKRKKKTSQINPGEAIFKSVKDMQKWVKKRQKGMSPWGSFNSNAGNVELCNSMFNHAMSSDGESFGGFAGGISNGGLSTGEGMGESLSLNESLEKYYRFEVRDPYGQNRGGIFRGLNSLIQELWDDDSWLYDDLNTPVSKLEYLTPNPTNITDPKTKFAYKQSFYNENEELFEDIEYTLNELEWSLVTIELKRPANIVYEDQVQIAFIEK